MKYERVWLEKPVMRLDNQTMTHVLQAQDGFVIERASGDDLFITHPKSDGMQVIPWARVIDARPVKEAPAEQVKGKRG